MKQKNVSAIMFGIGLLFVALFFTRRVREQFQTGPVVIGFRVSGSQAGIVIAQLNGLVAKVIDSATGIALFDEGTNILNSIDDTIKMYDLIPFSVDSTITVDLTKINTRIENSTAELPLILKNYILVDPATNAVSFNPPVESASTTTAAPTTTTTAPATTTTTAPATTTTAPATTTTAAATTTTAPATTTTAAATTTTAPATTTAGTTTMGTTEPKKDEGLSTGAIVGIAVVATAVVGGGIYLVVSQTSAPTPGSY